MITISSGNKCAIIIAPPDQSMLLCFSSREQKVSLFESHSHGKQGGVLAVASYEQIDRFVLFLEYNLCVCVTGEAAYQGPIIVKYSKNLYKNLLFYS